MQGQNGVRVVVCVYVCTVPMVNCSTAWYRLLGIGASKETIKTALIHQSVWFSLLSAA